MARPVIALLTDFGLQDHYVGVMKGVMLGICPDAQLVDITHDIAPQNIMAGALALESSFRYFPAGTIFLCVVDPGVGSSRRAMAVAAHGCRFVGPDNGLLSLAASDPSMQAVELTSAAHALPTISRTFEGRDRFAPAAAWLATGLPIDHFGPRVSGIVTLDEPAPRIDGRAIDGIVIAVDRFGNLMTNIRAAMLPSGTFGVEVGSHGVPHVVQSYAAAPAGSLCALVGSSDRLEIAERNGSAAARVGGGVGTAVRVRALA